MTEMAEVQPHRCTSTHRGQRCTAVGPHEEHLNGSLRWPRHNSVVRQPPTEAQLRDRLRNVMRARGRSDWLDPEDADELVTDIIEALR